MGLVFERSFDKLQGEAMNELINSTPITRVTPGSKARALLQTVNRKLNKAYQEFDVNLLQSFLPYAQGRFLDYLGDMLGVPRLGASRASASTESRTVRFSVSTGTFGDINATADISIPAGTLISSQAGNEGVVYRVPISVILNRLLSEQFVPVESVRDGDSQNVGVGTLRFHNITNVISSPSLLLVSNVGPISNGTTLENDTNYRFRIASQTLASERANETAIRLALLTLPGVSNIVASRFARGIGTFDVIIQSVIPNTPQSVIDACQEAVARVAAEGIDIQVVPPRLTGLTFEVSVTWRDDATAADRVLIKTRINEALSSYVNNLSIGDEFIVNEAIERVMGVDNKIKNIGTGLQAFDTVYLYRSSKLRDNRIKEDLLSDYDSDLDERIIIEPSVLTPIAITDRN